MSCSYCGNMNCACGCLGVAQQPLYIQGQAAGTPYYIGGGLFSPGGSSAVPVDTSINNFLEIIADKTDTEACVAFMEQQRQIHIKQIQEIERLQKTCKEDLEKAEQEFMAKCQKYRPTITSEILERVKGLKAFF